MHKLFLIFFSVIAFRCDKEYSFTDVECSENDVSYQVFKPCRQHIFRARYWGRNHDLISDERIWMMANGEKWISSEDQNEIVIQYEYEESKIESLFKYSINPEISDWSSMETTGIIENEKRIWMHPFRQNQYNFMEVAPFPEVELPLEIGKSWTGKLIINNWGVWSNSTVSKHYEIVNYEALDLAIGKIDAWHIKSLAEASFGNSTHNFWFHPDLGFVKMVIHNYAGQTLEIELIEVIED